MLGVLLLAPLAVRPVTGAAGAPLAAVTGVSGAVAVRNTRRNPRRASATAVALAIGVTVVTTLTVTIASARAVTEADTSQTLTADLAILGPGLRAGRAWHRTWRRRRPRCRGSRAPWA